MLQTSSQLQEYEKAIETYNTGLKHDPSNEELLEGLQRCFEAVSRYVCALENRHSSIKVQHRPKRTPQESSSDLVSLNM